MAKYLRFIFVLLMSFVGNIFLWYIRNFRGHIFSIHLSRPWTVVAEPDATNQTKIFVFVASAIIRNESPDRHFIPASVKAATTIVAKSEYKAIYSGNPSITAKIIPPDQRLDGYWPVIMVAPGEETVFRIEVGPFTEKDLEAVAMSWIRIECKAWGLHGLQSVLFDTLFSPENLSSTLISKPAGTPTTSWHDIPEAGKILSVRTHMLSETDDICCVIDRYAKPHVQPGDIVAISESALAITQGRYIHPDTVTPGILARLGCMLVPSITSLAIPQSMQVLINMIGSWTFVRAMCIGQIAKRFKIRGAFYRACGAGADLIDDMSGTLPPFDNFIVLGPVDPELVVQEISKRCGIAAAVVDISNSTRNNLILAWRGNTSREELLSLLAPNPAGNDDERTPLVILRPIRTA